eukprot:153680-Pyramimonas_sp.AAC.1
MARSFSRSDIRSKLGGCVPVLQNATEQLGLPVVLAAKRMERPWGLQHRSVRGLAQPSARRRRVHGRHCTPRRADSSARALHAPLRQRRQGVRKDGGVSHRIIGQSV